jgi:arylsulfatase A-like enzyme
MRFLAVLLVALAAFPSISGADAPARPNVLILLTDDQGYGDLSCHGNPVLKTPNMDRLHGQSVRFTDFHVSPMCSPTRGQLMTGVDALRNGATSVTAGRSFIRAGVPTMPAIFAAAGYRTGLFGKWHLGDNYPNRPMDRGFHEAAYHLGWGFTSAPEFTNTLFDGRCFHNGTEQKFSGYCTDFWFDQAMKWMKECKQKNQPFLCYLPTNAPHSPHVVGKEFSGPYEGRGPAGFFGMIANIDQNLGKLETFLSDSGLRDNTILIFMSDNGGTAGVKLFNAGMRGMKTQYYEGGHRAPCFVRWPAGKLRQPRDIVLPTQIQDILPTIIELCGISKPKESEFDGASLAGLLRGSTDQLSDRMLVVQYGQVPKKADACVIWKQWRLVKGAELYDIHVDPGQKDDVAAKHADVVDKMRHHYDGWWAKIEPKLTDFVPISIGANQQKLVSLTSSDWQDVYCDNSDHIRQAAGGPQGGAWNILVESDGEYEIALRRWPRELDLALSSKPDGPGKALPIATARLTIAGQQLSAKAAAGDKEVVLRAKLSKGKTQLHAWFQDADSKDLCGAFYAYVQKR